jgi:hypothetical protein
MSRTLFGKGVLLLVLLLPVSASALTLSPTKIEVAVDPGQQAIGEIELLNEEAKDKTFYLSYENFEPRGETGSPYFVGGGEGLASWITTQESVTLKAGERLNVPYKITVPSDATPGGYFAAVFFGTQPPPTGEGSEVAIGGKVGTLVLLRVNGPISESGGVLDFMTASSSRFFETLPVNFSYRFNNTGGDRVVPKGEVVIKNTFRMKTAALSLNETEGSVLPQSIRKFEFNWTEEETLSPDASFFETVSYQAANFRFGLYTASLEAVWGESSQRSSSTVWFIVFPWQLLLVSFVGLVALRFGLKAYNKAVIARAQK